MQRRIGIIPDRCARPLFSRFREPEFDIISGTPGELAVQLRGRKLDGAFLSPVDAAKHPGTFRPAGTAALVSRSSGGTARLMFREGIRTIESIAVDAGRTSEIVLAHLVLVEKYGSAPKIIPRTTGIDDLPASVDALLLTGDEAGRVSPSEPWIDLVEEWSDISGLPFVHALWYTSGDAFGEDDTYLFGPPEEGGVAAAGLASSEKPEMSVDPDQRAISYKLGEKERSGLVEFMTMAYYHGILKDYPEPASFLPGEVRSPGPHG